MSQNTQDMTLPRVELDVVPADVPRPLVAGEQVLHAVRGWKTRADRKDANAALHRGRVEVDDDDHVVVAGALEVTEQLLVLRLEERDVVEPLQRRVLAARPIERRDERQQRPVEAAALDLVLLRIE